MKKILFACALCALLAATAVACGGETTDPVDTSDTTPSEVTTVASPEVTEPVETPTEAPTEIPTETPTEEVTQDPMELCKPTYLITPEDLQKNASRTNNTNYCQQIMSATVIENYVTLTCSGSDPYVAAIKPGTRDAVTTKLLAIKYRTVDDSQGEVFIGSGSLWTGNGDNMSFSYIPDGEWHLVLVDLSSLASLGDHNARYLRFDFFTDGVAGRSIDVQYMAFFETAEQAEMYDSLVSQKPKNDSTFASDIAAQTNGTALKDTDLGRYFEVTDLENATSTVKDGAYVLSGNGTILKIVNGTYALVTDMKKADGETYVAMRLIGDTGIYAKVLDGQFVLKIDCKDQSHRYTIPTEGTVLTVADSGDKLYFLVDGKLTATVVLMGKTTYEDRGNTAYAATAYIRLSDGSSGKLQDTLISFDINASVGFVVENGELHLSSVKVQDFADVTIPAFEKFTMNLKEDLAASDYWMADVEQIGCVPHPDNQCTVKQGGWTDGTYYYQLFIKKDTASNEENNIVKLVKYNLETGEVVKTSEDLGLNHANDLTYNPRRNIFVAVHNNPHRKKLSIIDPETFEVVDTVTLDCKIFSLDYNETRDQYVIGVAGGQTFRVLNADFTYADDKIHQPTSLSKGYTTQGVACDDKYIYFVLYNQNCLTVYDWDGNFISYVRLNISGEPENLSVVGNEIYISSAHGDGARIFKIVDWQKSLPETVA